MLQLSLTRQFANARQKNGVKVNHELVTTLICFIPRNIYVKCSTRIALFSLHQPTLNKQMRGRPITRFINHVPPTHCVMANISLSYFLPYPVLLLWRFICGFLIESNDLYDLSPTGAFSANIYSYLSIPDSLVMQHSKLTRAAHKWN